MNVDDPGVGESPCHQFREVVIGKAGDDRGPHDEEHDQVERAVSRVAEWEWSRHALMSPGLPASTTNDRAALTGAPGLVTKSIVR